MTPDPSLERPSTGLPMRIEIDDLTRPEIHALLNEHLQNMYELSPPESVHALDIERLRKPEITFWSAFDGRSWIKVDRHVWTRSAHRWVSMPSGVEIFSKGSVTQPARG